MKVFGEYVLLASAGPDLTTGITDNVLSTIDFDQLSSVSLNTNDGTESASLSVRGHPDAVLEMLNKRLEALGTADDCWGIINMQSGAVIWKNPDGLYRPLWKRKDG